MDSQGGSPLRSGSRFRGNDKKKGTMTMLTNALYIVTIAILMGLGVFAFTMKQGNAVENDNELNALEAKVEDGTYKEAIFAGGCFWCVEAAFDYQKGVLATISGYIGGSAEEADYKKVSTGRTDHIEALRVIYDPKTIDYPQLLQTFWESIDPTDAGGQFADRGTQYRTAIFVINEQQHTQAEQSKARIQTFLDEPIATTIEQASAFYPAEEYHQDYHKKNGIHYKMYFHGSGRAAKLKQLWGEK